MQDNEPNQAKLTVIIAQANLQWKFVSWFYFILFVLANKQGNERLLNRGRQWPWLDDAWFEEKKLPNQNHTVPNFFFTKRQCLNHRCSSKKSNNNDISLKHNLFVLFVIINTSKYFKSKHKKN